MTGVLRDKTGREKYYEYLEKSCRKENNGLTPKEVNRQYIAKEVAKEYGVDPASVVFNDDGSINKNY